MFPSLKICNHAKGNARCISSLSVSPITLDGNLLTQYHNVLKRSPLIRITLNFMVNIHHSSGNALTLQQLFIILSPSLLITCGRGLAQQRVGRLHRGDHGAGCGVGDGGGVVGVLCLGAAVSLQPVRLGEHRLKPKTPLHHILSWHGCVQEIKVSR